mmetsp:Transcript_10493/g.40809  ORF Transcript_10493/g.40809 Transcript_10493/m.40809 type:complete len:225 (+) Transcript_10493:252-926(+)
MRPQLLSRAISSPPTTRPTPAAMLVLPRKRRRWQATPPFQLTSSPLRRRPLRRPSLRPSRAPTRRSRRLPNPPQVWLLMLRPPWPVRTSRRQRLRLSLQSAPRRRRPSLRLLIPDASLPASSARSAARSPPRSRHRPRLPRPSCTKRSPSASRRRPTPSRPTRHARRPLRPLLRPSAPATGPWLLPPLRSPALLGRACSPPRRTLLPRPASQTLGLHQPATQWQ